MIAFSMPTLPRLEPILARREDQLNCAIHSPDGRVAVVGADASVFRRFSSKCRPPPAGDFSPCHVPAASFEINPLPEEIDLAGFPELEACWSVIPVLRT